MSVPSPAPSVLRRVIRFVLICAVVALIAACVVSGVRMYQHASSLWQRLARVESLVSGQKGKAPGPDMVNALRQEFTGSRQDYRALRADVAPLVPLMQRLGWLPAVGPSVVAIPHLLQMGDDAMSAGTALFDGVQPLLDAVLAGKGSTSDEHIRTRGPSACGCATRFC